MENIEPSEFVEIDQYHQPLLDKGYDAVVNITETTKFLAVVKHAVFDALQGKCMVANIKTKLEHC